MPRFEIVGFGRETGRKRVRIYEAKDEEDAILMAASDGTVVEKEKTRILPEPPPTESQIEYAKNLGIKISKKTTKYQLSKLISQAVDEDWPTKKNLQKARKLKIDIPEDITDDDLEDLIFDCENEIEDEKEQLQEQREDERFYAQLGTKRKSKKGSKAESFWGLILVIVIVLVLIKSCAG